MKPKGLVAAARMTSHVSIPIRSHMSAISLARPMLTERKVFSSSFTNSAAEGDDGPGDLDAACAFARRLGQQVLDHGLPRGVLLNVNFPTGVPQGVRVARQGTRTYRATSLERVDPAGRPYYWIAGIDMTPTGEVDGDHAAIAAGFISVSPLRTNMTDEAALGVLGRWELEIH